VLHEIEASAKADPSIERWTTPRSESKREVSTVGITSREVNRVQRGSSRLLGA
jgi:hypothetical protein